MPDLTITLKRHPDGSASLSCTRRDGTRTWQRQNGRLAQVFPQHDLTHYAVETALGYRHGFYGLIADGWDIGDFTAPWPRGPIPAEAGEVELIVGFLDTERTQGTEMSPEELDAHAQRYVEGRRAKRPGAVVPLPPSLDAGMLEQVRARRTELIARWFALAPGGALELPFDRDR